MEYIFLLLFFPGHILCNDPSIHDVYFENRLPYSYCCCKSCCSSWWHHHHGIATKRERGHKTNDVSACWLRRAQLTNDSVCWPGSWLVHSRLLASWLADRCGPRVTQDSLVISHETRAGIGTERINSASLEMPLCCSIHSLAADLDILDNRICPRFLWTPKKFEKKKSEIF